MAVEGCRVHGVMMNADQFTPEGLVAHVQRLEALGYESVWFTDLLGRDTYVTAAHILAKTERIKVGSGIAHIYGRDALASAQAARTLAELSGGRFLHGLGVSHASITEARGLVWEDPVAKATEYVTAVRDPQLLRFGPAEQRVPVYLAAHGPKMIAAAAAVADGVLTYMQTPQSCAEIRRVVGPDKPIAMAAPCCLTTDPTIGRHMGRNALRIYLPLPAYHRIWRAAGFDEGDWTAPGSDRLVDTYVTWGDLDTIAARFGAYLAAGVTNLIVSVSPNVRGDFSSTWELLEALAPGA